MLVFVQSESYTSWGFRAGKEETAEGAGDAGG